MANKLEKKYSNPVRLTLSVSLFFSCILISSCSSKSFHSSEECANYVSQTSMTEHKLKLGLYACSWAFVDINSYASIPNKPVVKDVENTKNEMPTAAHWLRLKDPGEIEAEALQKRKEAGSAKVFSLCIINNIESIDDDNTGKKVISKCAQSTSQAPLGRIWNNYFSGSGRNKVIGNDTVTSREQQSDTDKSGYILSPMPTTIEIDEKLLTCTRMSPNMSISCF